MGIDISAKLIYGLRYSDVPEDIIERVDEGLDSGELDYASPYYDAPPGLSGLLELIITAMGTVTLHYLSS